MTSSLPRSLVSDNVRELNKTSDQQTTWSLNKSLKKMIDNLMSHEAIAAESQDNTVLHAQWIHAWVNPHFH